MEDVIYDVKATREHFKEKHTRLSWSSFDNFQTCQGLWFTNFFLKPPTDMEVTLLPRESSRAIPGTVIQKVMEVFVNDRVYSRPEMTDLQKIIDWMQTNSTAVFYMSKIAAELQFLPEYTNTRRFWETDFGKNFWNQIYKQYRLDPAIKEVNLSFVNGDTFSGIYGTEESFLSSLNALYPQIVNTLLKEEIFLDRVLSEISLKAHVNGFDITGSVDFLYNPGQKDNTPFTTLSQLEDGYFLFDGKYNISSYTKKEQLFFYAFILYIMTKKSPKRLALLQWNKTKFKDFELDRDYPLHVVKVLEKVNVVSGKILSFLEHKSELHGLFFADQFVDLNPSDTNCQFCNAFSCCKAAKEAGVSFGFDFAQKIKAKQEAKKAISEVAPGINDICL